MRRKSTFRWSGIKKTPPQIPPDVELSNTVPATVHRRANNLKASVDRNSLSSTGSSTNSDEGIFFSLLPHNANSLQDSEYLKLWLTSIQFEEYIPLFLNAGYDMPTISRMTPADLSAIGITKPLHRRKLMDEIQRLNIADGIPNFIPKSLLEWLKLIRLSEYYDILCQQEYDSIAKVTDLTWEDLEEIGIKKLGHQKRLDLAIKRIKDLSNGVRRSSTHYSNLSNSTPSSSSLSSESSSSSFPDAIYSNSNLNLQVKYPLALCQEVTINTFNRKNSGSPLESPCTPELKTFQPVEPIYSRNTNVKQMSRDCNLYVRSVDGPNVNSSSRGRSCESLNKGESESCKLNIYLQQYMSRLQKQGLKQELCNVGDNCDKRNLRGYESDIEPRVEIIPNDFDMNATLNKLRPTKTKPIAKIAGRSRQEEHVFIVNEGQTNGSREKLYDYSDIIWNEEGKESDRRPLNYRGDDVLASASIYATLKKNKLPPPPPKRTNSMKSSTFGSVDSTISSRCSSVEAMQEQAFVTCVKSLTSRFSMISDELPPLPVRNHKITPRIESNDFDDDDFPPPPSPLPFECDEEETIKGKVKENGEKESNDKEANMSSSSSTESMPFANENIGTMKQRIIENGEGVNVDFRPELIDDCRKNELRVPKSSLEKHCLTAINEKKPSQTNSIINNSNNNKESSDVIEDIETMLSNLSSQLDALLEDEMKGKLC